MLVGTYVCCWLSVLVVCMSNPLHVVILPQPDVAFSQVYLYMRFPSETITRSGYQIKRKHLAVASTRNGTVYACGAR